MQFEVGKLRGFRQACTEALTLGVDMIATRVGRGAEDVAALEAVCPSFVSGSAALAVEVHAGPGWSDAEVREKVAELAATLDRHAVRGELHAFDERVLVAAADLAPDRRRVAMINSLSVATGGVRGAAGWVVRTIRPAGSDIDAVIDRARRAEATGLAVAHQLLSESLVQRTAAAGMPIAAWGATGSVRVRELIAMGVNEIRTTNTDRVALLRAEVAEQGFAVPDGHRPEL